VESLLATHPKSRILRMRSHMPRVWGLGDAREWKHFSNRSSLMCLSNEFMGADLSALLNPNQASQGVYSLGATELTSGEHYHPYTENPSSQRIQIPNLLDCATSMSRTATDRTVPSTNQTPQLPPTNHIQPTYPVLWALYDRPPASVTFLSNFPPLLCRYVLVTHPPRPPAAGVAPTSFCMTLSFRIRCCMHMQTATVGGVD